MKVVFLQAPQDIIERRKKLGLDRWDEVWDGVLHMVPPPSFWHQKIRDDLYFILRGYCERYALGIIVNEAGVKDINSPATEENYRIPDISFISKGREEIISQDGWINSGPDVVIEVRSPDDETYEKMPFYERIGVREIIIVDRDTKKVEIYRLVKDKFVAVSPNTEGWLYCEGLKAYFKTSQIEEGKPVLKSHLALDKSEHQI